MATKASSPYLNDAKRLADVIAAIQATATYKFYKLDFKDWADRLAGDESQASYWQTVFEEHSEFFRLDSAKAKASLVWRRQNQKLYDVDTEEKITRTERECLSASAMERISRSPLGTDEIATLIQAAIDLHSRALDHQRELRWWIPVVAGLVGVVVGALIQALIK